MKMRLLISCFIALVFACNPAQENNETSEIDEKWSLDSNFIFQEASPLNLEKILPIFKTFSFEESEKFVNSLFVDSLSALSRSEVEAIFKPSQNYFFYENEACHFMSFEDSLDNFITFTVICYSKYDQSETYLITCDYTGYVIDNSRLGGYSHGSDSYGTGEIWEWNIAVTKQNAFEYNLFCTEIVPFDEAESKEIEYRTCEYLLVIDSVGIIDNIEISDWKTATD